MNTDDFKTEIPADAKPVLYVVATPPKEKDPIGDGWSKDIILIQDDKEYVGYFDPQGSIAGGKYFYYLNGKIMDCATLKPFPTYWRYAEQP